MHPTDSPALSMSPTLTEQPTPHQWPMGFQAAGGTAGLKPSGRPDVALLLCDGPRHACAAIFTTNLVQAAPVRLSRAHLLAAHGRCSALFINSGCANAATGPEGDRRASLVTTSVAAALGLQPTAVLHNSTGVIGVQLDTDKVAAAIPGLLSRLAAGSVEPFATGILTTDTHLKSSSVRVTDSQGRSATVTGAVKGAGMIHPNMATLIGTITTDATLEPEALDRILRAAVDRSFHRISIDGDTSTNDAVFSFASGARPAIDEASLQEAFTTVALSLARQVVMDAEGYERGLEVVVRGAPSQADALQVARTVGQSLLVRTAITGGDPNWGRILAAMGRAGVVFDPAKACVTANGLPLFTDGAPAPTPREQLRQAFSSPHVTLEIDLHAGAGADRFLTCGLTKAYVEFNAEYTT